MTKTALANKELRLKEDLQKREHAWKHNENVKDRNLQRDITDSKNATQLWSSGINAVGRLGGSLAKFNDPAWYKNYVKDLDTFVNVPTYDRLGSNILSRIYCREVGLISASKAYWAVPGVMAIHWIPSTGTQGDDNVLYRNPINETLSRLKEKVLALNSRSSVNWDPADIGYNIFCSADLMSCIIDLGRVIRIYNTYHGKNAYLAEVLIRATGWNYSDIEANFADYRKTYNKLAKKFNSSVVAPVDMSIYMRRAYLSDNVFIDTEDAKDPRQMYMYVQDYAFTLANDGSFAQILTIDRSSLSAWRAAMNTRFERIIANPDFVEMYQDLRHAFGTRLVQLPECMDAVQVTFNNAPLNREQIHNTKILPMSYEDDNDGVIDASITHNNWALRQDSSGYLFQGGTGGPTTRTVEYPYALNYVQCAWATANLHYAEGNVLFNLHKDSNTGDDILDITRNSFGAKFTGSSSTGILLILTCGTEVFTKGRIHIINEDGSSDVIPFSSYVVGPSQTLIQSSTMLNHLGLMSAARSAFDWAPITQYCITNTAGDVQYFGTYCDTRLTFTIDQDSLQDIHSAAVLSELYVPELNFIK